MSSSKIKIGALFEDGEKVFVYTGKEFRELKAMERRFAIHPRIMREVTYRLFRESHGKLRCWTSDWKVTQAMLEQAEYFAAWESPDMKAIIQATGQYVFQE